jgi:aspartate aminotransferase-like enzyme
MGAGATEETVLRFLRALEAALAANGHKLSAGASTGAASRLF